MNFNLDPVAGMRASMNLIDSGAIIPNRQTESTHQGRLAHELKSKSHKKKVEQSVKAMMNSIIQRRKENDNRIFTLADAIIEFGPGSFIIEAFEIVQQTLQAQNVSPPIAAVTNSSVVMAARQAVSLQAVHSIAAAAIKSSSEPSADSLTYGPDGTDYASSEQVNSHNSMFGTARTVAALAERIAEPSSVYVCPRGYLALIPHLSTSALLEVRSGPDREVSRIAANAVTESAHFRILQHRRNDHLDVTATLEQRTSAIFNAPTQAHIDLMQRIKIVHDMSSQFVNDINGTVSVAKRADLRRAFQSVRTQHSHMHSMRERPLLY